MRMVSRHLIPKKIDQNSWPFSLRRWSQLKIYKSLRKVVNGLASGGFGDSGRS